MCLKMNCLNRTFIWQVLPTRAPSLMSSHDLNWTMSCSLGVMVIIYLARRLNYFTYFLDLSIGDIIVYRAINVFFPFLFSRRCNKL